MVTKNVLDLANSADLDLIFVNATFFINALNTSPQLRTLNIRQATLPHDHVSFKLKDLVSFHI